MSLKFSTPEHLTFLGLTHNPFPVAPDDTDFFVSRQTDVILERIETAILTRKGFLLFTGEIGLGKTTITRRMVHILEEKNVETALILQSFYQKNDLLVAINRDFGIVDDDISITRQMELLNDFLFKKKPGRNQLCHHY